MSSPNDTIAALATPVGTAALAVIRISGVDTERVVSAAIGSAPPPRRARHADYHALDGTLLDDVVVILFAAPKSYTGESAAEISCHGNPYIAQRILEDLFGRGCRPARPGEFTQRAFLNGRMDLSQAEAVMDVIHARSERALAAAQQQLRGVLGRRMQALVDDLVGLVARVEAYIDFPEEDLPPEDGEWLKRELDRLKGETDRLLATSHYGAVLRDGINTVIVGAPNVGKSSLLNRLVGHERALVSPEAGTTRDFLEERLTIGPHLLRIVDTAGLNPFPTPLEKLGMQKTLERADQADLFLLVYDATGAVPPAPPPELGAKLSAENSIIVLNKIDQASPNALPSWTEAMVVVRTSATRGDGIEALQDQIVRLADRLQVDVGNDAVAISARHAHALREARRALEAAQVCLAGQPLELVASELRAVMAAYGEITGRIEHEDVLDRLFASFCIGK